MQAAESSSAMIFRQINQQNTSHQIHLKSNPKRQSQIPRKHSQISKNTQNQHNKENLHTQQKQSQSTGQNLPNKRQSNLKVNYKITENPDEQDQSKEITLIKVSLTENKRLSGTQNLKSLFSHEPYIKQLVQSLPANNCHVSTICRKGSLFSTAVSMWTSKGQQLLKYAKKNSCLGNEYEIISQNSRYNVVGTVRTNFWGTTFNVYQRMEQSSEQRLVGTIYYDDEFVLSKKTRLIQIYLVSGSNKSALQHHETYQKDSLKKLYQQGDNKVIKLINKKPILNTDSQYAMDFGTDGVIPSVKNAIMIEQKTQKEAIKLIKIDDDDFKLKVCQNMSVFLGYCFALSSLVFKLGCQ